MNTVEHKQNILEVKYQGCTKDYNIFIGCFTKMTWSIIKMFDDQSYDLDLDLLTSFLSLSLLFSLFLSLESSLSRDMDL